MATLESVQGSSLVVDPTSALNLLLQTFGTGPQRAAQAEQRELIDIVSQPTEQLQDPQARAIVDVARAFPGGEAVAPLPEDIPGVSQAVKEKALIRLAALNPQAAAGVRATLDANDKFQTAALTKEVDEGIRLAAVVSSKGSFAEKRKALTTIATDKALQGQDLSRVLELRNMTEDQLNLNLTRMKAQGLDMKTLLAPTTESRTERNILNVPIAETKVETSPLGVETITERTAPVQPEQFVEVLDEEGRSTGVQQSTTSQKLEAIPGRGPQTDFGKIEVDRRNGLLTDEQAETQRATLAATPPKFQSTVGKLLGDQTLAIGIYGAESAQVKAIQAVIDSEQKGDTAPKFNDISGLRKEHTKASGDFIKTRDAVNKINAASPNAAGDLSLIFNYMKVLDPQSTVRESEFANAQNAAGVGVRIQNVWNKLLAGEFISDPQRKQFKAEALLQFGSQQRSQDVIDEAYSAIAKRFNINPKDVIIDWKAGIIPAKTKQEEIVESIKLPKTP